MESVLLKFSLTRELWISSRGFKTVNTHFYHICPQKIFFLQAGNREYAKYLFKNKFNTSDLTFPLNIYDVWCSFWEWDPKNVLGGKISSVDSCSILFFHFQFFSNLGQQCASDISNLISYFLISIVETDPCISGRQVPLLLSCCAKHLGLNLPLCQQ